jgi:predicted ABC-type ATPase
LPQEAACPDFINADLIAAGLSPFQPEAAAVRAGRLVVEEIRERVRQRRSFAFETPLSGLSYARQIPAWQAAGYHVQLFFLQLPSVELALARVAARVSQGGHFVPDAVVSRRFLAGRKNFECVYRALVNHWLLYDNSGDTPVLVADGENP